MILRRLILLVALTLPLEVSASTIVGFEGFGSATEFSGTITLDGFEFNASKLFLGNNIINVASNGSGVLVMPDNLSIMVTRAGGGEFDLIAGDFGMYDGYIGWSARRILVTGFLASGGTVTQSIPVNSFVDTFSNHDLPFMRSLSAVSFEGSGAGNFYYANGFALDNLEIEVSPVPLPAAAWLLGSALIGLAGVAKRRKVYTLQGELHA